MVTDTAQGNEVVLIYAGQPLVLQVAEWIRKHTDYTLRLVSAEAPVAVEAAVNSAAMVIIDGSKDPDGAIDVLEIAAERLGRQRIAVYTEKFHDGLEVLVRMHGCLMLPGPMSAFEWEGVFEPVRRGAVAAEPVV